MKESRGQHPNTSLTSLTSKPWPLKFSTLKPSTKTIWRPCKVEQAASVPLVRLALVVGVALAGLRSAALVVGLPGEAPIPEPSAEAEAVFEYR